MKLFGWWSLGGAIIIISHYVSTLESSFFTYDSFTFIFTIWMVLGIYATWDLVKSVRRDSK